MLILKMQNTNYKSKYSTFENFFIHLLKLIFVVFSRLYLNSRNYFGRQSTDKSTTYNDSAGTVDQSLESREACVSAFLGAYLYPLMRIITAGVGEWTTDSRYVRTHNVSVHILCYCTNPM
jgi:hypothetical protein